MISSKKEKMFWFVFLLVFTSININGLKNEERKTLEPEFDEDDDVDPFDDDDEQIKYPVKSVMPEIAMSKDGPKILPEDGSGQPSQSMINS